MTPNVKLICAMIGLSVVTFTALAVVDRYTNDDHALFKKPLEDEGVLCKVYREWTVKAKDLSPRMERICNP